MTAAQRSDLLRLVRALARAQARADSDGEKGDR
jgi:hypothetical protein